MSGFEIASIVARQLAFVALYFFIGFGPGFVFGIMLANTFLARGSPTLMEKHKRAIREAAQHNAQWNPSHERWRSTEGATSPRETEQTEV